MKKIVFILVCACFSAGLWAQTEEQQQVAPAPKFKPHYAGASVDAGFMLMPRYGSAFYVAPKLTFQAAPRLFINAGVGLIQYNPMPPQMKLDGGSGSLRQIVTGAYIFAEGVYLLNERWSVNGSVMKDASPSPMRRTTPYSVPSEAVHFGVDYRITPNITVGARVGYSNGGRHSMYDPFYPY
ncbi:MAG: hypothetical protein LBL24_02750 [Bacteroidales bacterium]|nr:hypothetical protein [Bacteroidales bacterium]